MSKSPRVLCTTFRGGPRSKLPPAEAKREQEALVVAGFVRGLQQLGHTAVQETTKQDPPDALVHRDRALLGVELVELEAAYEERAFVEQLTNTFYAETERRNFASRFTGTAISICISRAEFGFPEAIREEWNWQGITKGFQAFASELAELVSTRVVNRDTIPVRPPECVPGLTFWTTGNDALSAVTSSITVNRSPEADLRRSDGRAAPVLLVTPTIMYRDHELSPRVRTLLSRKMGDRSRWTVDVDRAVLVTHDLPRIHYKSFNPDWEKELAVACRQLPTAGAFDEIWLVSFASPFADPTVLRVDALRHPLISCPRPVPDSAIRRTI
jgi:hypothetical protein